MVYTVRLYLASPYTITYYKNGIELLLMQIFMAGGISGNLSSFWKKLCYELNNDNSYENSIDKAMKSSFYR